MAEGEGSGMVRGMSMGGEGNSPHRPRWMLGICGALHFLHDGFGNALYILFPLAAADLHLEFSQVGLLKTVYSGALGFTQLPMGLLAEHLGEAAMLATGLAGTSTGFFLAGWAPAYPILLICLLLAGLSASIQHPVSSALVSRAYEASGRRRALGTLNFAGDLGKICLLPLVALWAGLFRWRAAFWALGLLGISAAAGLWLIRRTLAPAVQEPNGEALRPTPAAGRWGIQDRGKFRRLVAIGMIDDSTRTVLLTFLPFLMLGRGMRADEAGILLTLLFMGGAVGKFVCGALAERAGVVALIVATEVGTAAGIAAMIVAPVGAAPFIAVPLGIALNGTSSVLYGSVADLAAPGSRSRAYGLFYTLYLGSGALAPSVAGIVADLVGLRSVLVLMVLVILLAIPLAFALGEFYRPGLSARRD